MTDVTIERETLERQRFETWALLNHSMRDQEWFTESANDGTLADDLTDSWAAWRAAQPAEPVHPVCSLCQGTGVVDDGEINCYPNGEPYLNGPVQCVKDCPRCASKPAEPVQRLSDARMDGIYNAWRDMGDDVSYGDLMRMVEAEIQGGK